MAIWRKKGYDLIVVARDKDVVLQLLDHSGYDYQVLSRVRRGLSGLALELLEHESKLLKIIRREKPDVILEVAGTFVVHAAALTRTPALVFYDTEHARLQNAITYPFATRIITPDSYKDDLGRKHVRYNGYQELAYLHPNYFTPDPSILDELGLAEGEKYSLVRLVSWDASHDRGHRGLPADFHQSLVHRLAKYGRVFISAEGNLPHEFESYRLKAAPNRMHDILAYAQLYLGEGATMASEAAILGTPAIYVNTLFVSTLEEQEVAYQLVYNCVDPTTILSTVDQLLQDADTQLEFHERSKRLLADKIDLTQWIVNFANDYL